MAADVTHARVTSVRLACPVATLPHSALHFYARNTVEAQRDSLLLICLS